VYIKNSSLSSVEFTVAIISIRGSLAFSGKNADIKFNLLKGYRYHTKAVLAR
jgi:hypothetical protein